MVVIEEVEDGGHLVVEVGVETIKHNGHWHKLKRIHLVVLAVVEHVLEEELFVRQFRVVLEVV